jgi:hypothetical protein
MTDIPICDKGVLTSLNLAENRINGEGAMHIAEAIKVTECGCGYFHTSFMSI